MIHIAQNLFVSFGKRVSGKTKSRVLRLLQKDIHPEEDLKNRFDMDFSMVCCKTRDKFCEGHRNYVPTFINLVVIDHI